MYPSVAVLAGRCRGGIILVDMCTIGVYNKLMRKLKAVWTRTMIIDAVATGKAARRVREESGKSLRCVARIMGVSPSYLSAVERGKKNWSPNLVWRFNEAIGRKG